MQNTFDDCPRVVEYTNGGCFAPVATIPGGDAPIDGWYRGPFSRCLEQSPSFGRNGARYSGDVGTVDCYRMSCVGGELHVVIDGYNVPCPEGELVNLDAYPGAYTPRACTPLCVACRIACQRCERCRVHP